MVITRDNPTVTADAVVSVVLCGGLMVLLFYSSRNNYDR